MSLSRHFLPWDRPLLPQAVAFLAKDWDGAGPLDLSRVLAVVPTRQAGRRLREALAGHAAKRGRAAFPPRVVTPEALVASDGEVGSASRLESLLAWIQVFTEADLDALREVFPHDPPSRNFTWSLRLAEQFMQLQATLAEGGLRLADVVKAATKGDPAATKEGRARRSPPSGGEGGFPESARWTQIALLESRYDEKLAARGRRDSQAAKIASASAPVALAGVDRIVVLASPDPLALAVTALAAHARLLPVEIVIFAPLAEADGFDPWGRPLVAVWEARGFDLPDFEHRVHLCADPSAQAKAMAEFARGYQPPVGLLGLGIADPEVLPMLERTLADAGIATFNPEGRPRSRGALCQLLSALAALAREPSFDAVEILARCPDFLAFLRARVEGFRPAGWLAGLDELRARHLPGSLAAAQAHAPALEGFPGLVPGLAAMSALAARLGGGAFAEDAAAVLSEIFAGRRLDLGRGADAQLEDDAAAWTAVLAECAAAAPAAKLPPAEWWDLALQLFGESIATGEKPADAMELQGWLELPWEDAPHLAVAGCNDGRIPGAILGDPFLPEKLRECLGLKTNGIRFARDNYLLNVLASCRARGGRLDLLVGKVSEAGEPLRPSRLLLGCADAALPGRVDFLFQPAPLAQASPPWRRAWQLRPPLAPPLRRLPVTAFRDYLACPFRFYLKHALRFSSLDLQKSELDPADFGTLCHAALEAIGLDPALRDCTDGAILRASLLESLERGIRARFGGEVSLPLLIQLESARQRLGRAAEVQAEQRAAGWVIAETERKFTLEIGGLLVSGKIDRVERQEETGQRRVLDYKTADRPAAPAEAHSRRVARQGETAPAFARFTIGGKERVWTDLQLPLYLEAMAQADASPVRAGYFNLPKAIGETAVATWDDYDDAWRAAAHRCAAGVVEAVTAGIFWPPAEPRDREDELFAGLFHQGTAASIDPAFPLLRPASGTSAGTSASQAPRR